MPNGKEVKEYLFDKKNTTILKFAKRDSLYNSQKTFDRDEYPIIVGKKDNKIVVYDGNRRLIKNILKNKDTIIAYKGKTVKQPMFCNYWVPTSRILDLVSQANSYFESDDKATARAFSRTAGHLIQTSEVGRTEFYNRVINNIALKGRKFILKEVEKIIEIENSPK